MIFTSREDQYWATRIEWDDTAKVIKEKWDEGYAITDLVYGDGMYYVLLEKGTGILAQEFLKGDSLSEALGKKGASPDPMCVTTLLCAESFSLVVRSKLASSIEQRWCRSATFPKKAIKQYWKDGFAITAMHWNNGHWLILFSKGITYAHKESWATLFNPTAFKLSKLLNKESKIVSSLCSGDGKWAFSYARHPEIYSQKVYMGKEFPENEITELWNLNYDISKAAYRNGQWIFTFISSNQEEFKGRERFLELYRAKKFSEAVDFFKEFLYQTIAAPEPVILDYLQCFIRLKQYEEGIKAFEHFSTMFSTYFEALQIGGNLYYLASKQNGSQAYIRKALKYYTLISPVTPDTQKKINDLRPMIQDGKGGNTAWKRKLARKEQEKRISDKEVKNKKF